MNRRARSILIISLGLLLAPSSARAEDTVYLRDGKVVKGRVIDKGSTIVVERPHGSIVYERKDVARIEGDYKTELPPAPADDQDTVELNDGKLLRGRVTLSEDGKEVIIATKDYGEARHPIDVVRAIKFKNGQKVGPDGKTPIDDAGSRSLREAVDRHLADLKSEDLQKRATARTELLELAPFAVQYLTSMLSKDDPAQKELLDDIFTVRELKGVIGPKLEERVPRIYELLVDREPKKRSETVNKVVLDCPDEAPPLLLHLLKKDPSAAVRSTCVAQLGLLRRYEDLAQVLKTGDGQLRLAAALELASSGIFAGIPVIIEALRLKDQSLRELANDRLRSCTGKEFGFLPGGTQEEREVAIKKWEDWWRADGTKLLHQSLKAWREGEVSEEEKKVALDEWRSGNKILEELDARDRGEAKGKDGAVKAPIAEKERAFELERAAHAFQKSLEADPTLSAARISRAIVLSDGLRRGREAAQELRLVLERFSPQDAVLPRKLAQFHLGRIAQLEGDLVRASLRYEDAARIDPDYAEALVALGDVHLERAFTLAETLAPAGGAGGGSPKGDAPKADKTEGPEKTDKPEKRPEAPARPVRSLRESAIESAVIAYRQAIQAFNRREEALVNATKDLTSPEGVASFSEGRLLSSIREDRQSIERRAAEVYFRLGRAHAARHDDRMALDSFRAARRLAPNEKRYSEVTASFEKALEKKSAPANDGK